MNDFSEKNILAIDTATSMLNLALSFGGDRLVKSSEEVERSHSRFMFKKIGELLQSSDLKKEKLDALVVSCGPGSFTGLRIGISAVKGMAVALDIPIATVSMFEIAAYVVTSSIDPYGVVIQLTREQFFLSEITDGKYSLENTAVVSEAELILKNRELKMAMIGGDIHKSVPDLKNLIGDGNIAYDAASLLYLGREKLSAGEIAEINNLEPLYLQKSQAEINFEKRQHDN